MRIYTLDRRRPGVQISGILLKLAVMGILFCFFCVNVSARADNKAEYLMEGLHFSPSGISHRKLMIDALKKKAMNADGPFLSDAGEIRGIVFFDGEASEKGAFGFITETACEQNAVYAGTFLNSDSCSEQYRFLTGVNGFTEHSASRCLQPGADLMNIYPGDIIFWLDGSGTPVNVGFVCEYQESCVQVALCVPEKGVLLGRLSRDIMESLGNFTVVHPDYAFNEHLIYLYCVNTLHYTRSGACGVVANVHFESSSLSEREEQDLGIGYGICQWSFERRDALEQYCMSHGLDVSLLESQLEFMGYELENDFKFTGDFLRSAPETEAGAYDSGYWFCFEYEQPYDFETVSADRAELSRDLWDMML